MYEGADTRQRRYLVAEINRDGLLRGGALPTVVRHALTVSRRRRREMDKRPGQGNRAGAIVVLLARRARIPTPLLEIYRWSSDIGADGCRAFK